MPSFPAPYARLNAYIAPAGTRSELWRILIGLLIAAVVGFLSIQGIMLGLVALSGPDRARAMAIDLATGSTPQGVVALLFCYLPIMGGLALALALMMRRGLHSLIGPLGPALRNFLWVALPLMGLWLTMLPFAVMGDNVSAHLTLGQQLPWLPFALAGLLVQTGTEELVFRGYLQQHLAARFRSRWVWMGVPSVLFGLAHYSAQQYGALSWLVVAWTALFGVVAADLTARTGNLGAAVGLHFANNVSAVLLIGMSGNIGGLALFNAAVDTSDLSGALVYLALDTVTLLIGWLMARLILRV